MRRVGRACAVAVATALCLLVVRESAAKAERPLIARSKMLSADEIRPGMKGIGKSVFAGTRVESFRVTVLGVLRRVDFGGDIILVSIDSGPPVAKGFGIVSGMSGSPVYIGGKLIGALAYTWPFAKRPIAGVTPIAQMLEAFQPGSSPVRREGSLRATQPFLIGGERIERATIGPAGAAATASRGSGSMNLIPITTPLLVSGMNPAALQVLRGGFEPLGLMPVAGAGSMGHIKTRMEPGAAVGARLVSGDFDMTAVGTVTYVSGDVVLAFGHTMSSLGSTEVPLVAAYVHGVMPSAELSFKLASGGQTLGRFTEDRPWCAGGRLGAPPKMVGTTIGVVDRDRSVSRDYHIRVVRNRSMTGILMTAAMVGAMRSLGLPSEGTTRVRFSVEAEGLPRMTRRNTYAVEEEPGLLALLLGPSAAVASATGELSQILDSLQNSDFGEAKLARLGIAVELSKKRRVARLEQLAVDRHSVKPGEEVQLTATLRVADAGRVTRAEKVLIPPTCPPGRVQIGVAGGRSADWLRARLEVTEPRPESLTQMVKQVLGRPANDELVVQLALPTVGVEARGLVLRDLPPAVTEVLRSVPGTRVRPLRDYVERREPMDWVVSGYGVVSLTVEGEEKDKGGRPPSPQLEGFLGEEMPPGLAGLFSGFGLLLPPRATRVAASEDEEVSPEDEPPMPSWEEVNAVGEIEIAAPPAPGEGAVSSPPRGEAIGRLATIWRLSAEKELSQGERQGVAVMSSGGLALAPRGTVVGRVSAQCLWPVAVAPDGSVYTGSWGDGSLRRTTADGTTTVVLETVDAAVQAITVAKDGTVYAAAVPSGTIYRIVSGAKPAALCRLDAPLIWALEVSDPGAVWAATGPEGKLFRVGPDGSVSLAFTAADRHITALASGVDGALYLATAPRGKVYAIDPGGGGRAIFEADKSSLQSIAVDAAGSIYVGTSADGRVLRIDKVGAVTELFKGRAKHVLALRVGPNGVVYAATGPEAKVYGIWPDRSWAELYNPKSAYVAGMAVDNAGAIYLAAADTGQLIKLDPTSDRRGSFISPVRDAGARARWGAVRWQGNCPDGAAVSILTRSGDSGHPDSTWSDWQAVSLGPGATVGSPTARFLQCRVDMQGGKDGPRVEAVEVSYLPANRASEISISSPKGGEIWAGKKTVRWSGRDPDNDKLSYDLFYSGDNGLTWTKIEGPVKVQKGGEGEEAETQGQEKATPERPAKPEPAGPAAERGAPKPVGPTPSKPTLSGGGAQEPGFGGDDGSDGDSGLGPAARPPAEGRGGEETEQPEEEGPSEKREAAPSPTAPSAVTTTSLEWDTSKVPDGAYRVKLKASDRAANPTDAQEVEAISLPFTVDNSPPELVVGRARKDTEAAPEEIGAFDRASYLTSAEFRVDSGEWQAAAAKDGLFDGQREGILLDRARLPAGAHQLEIRCRDAAGNVASATLRYTTDSLASG